MTKKFKDDDLKESDLNKLDNICEECDKKDQSVNENLMLTGYKLCKSCRTSKTLFPV